MSTEVDPWMRVESRDGMSVSWNVPIRMADGVVLRADVFAPPRPGRYPVILTLGVYAKGLPFQEGYPMQWQKLVEDHPEVLEGSTNKYQAWEVTDPERWVPHDYVVVRVDSRGSGWSEGKLHPMSPQEDEDLLECIEWAGQQPWSDGNVGMLGISYYAVMQWRAASRNPRYLKAIIPWEGFLDYYRDPTRHGGILSEFSKRWAAIQAVTVQYGLGSRAKTNPHTGQSVAGPVDLSDEELANQRTDIYLEALERPFDDAYYRARTPDVSRINIPLLSAANWGGQGIHPRGNFLGFMQAGSRQKWLEVHGDTHWSPFYTNYGLDLQRRFFDRFLKHIDNGWDDQPAVMLNVRHVDGRFERRDENEWPIARTRWTRYYLDADKQQLTLSLPSAAQVSYEAFGDGVRFMSMPVETTTEVTGPIAARLYISCSKPDTDLFLTVQVFGPDGKELTFQGALDPNTPIAMGWLRASHRRVDPARSTAWQPYHTHDRAEMLEPGSVYECDIEILPTSIVLPPGWRFALWVRGKDYEYQGDISGFGSDFYYATRGTGGMTHNEPLDRPREIFDAEVTLHCGGDHASYVLLPIVPPKQD